MLVVLSLGVLSYYAVQYAKAVQHPTDLQPRFPFNHRSKSYSLKGASRCWCLVRTRVAIPSSPCIRHAHHMQHAQLLVVSSIHFVRKVFAHTPHPACAVVSETRSVGKYPAEKSRFRDARSFLDGLQIGKQRKNLYLATVFVAALLFDRARRAGRWLTYCLLPVLEYAGVQQHRQLRFSCVPWLLHIYTNASQRLFGCAVFQSIYTASGTTTTGHLSAALRSTFGFICKGNNFESSVRHRHDVLDHSRTSRAKTEV